LTAARHWPTSSAAPAAAKAQEISRSEDTSLTVAIGCADAKGAAAHTTSAVRIAVANLIGKPLVSAA
jgi:hypothetical protein